jgi:hypothetical protein
MSSDCVLNSKLSSKKNSQINSFSFKSASIQKTKTDIKKRGNKILRQELESYTFECNPKCAIIFNLSLIFLLLATGVPIILLTKNLKEFKFSYSNWYDIYKFLIFNF